MKLITDDGVEIKLSAETSKRLRGEFCKPEPPKIEHGHYGELDDYGSYLAVKCAHRIRAEGGEILLVSNQGLTNTPANQEVYLKQWHYGGDIFADLERNKVDLAEFEMVSDVDISDTVEAHIAADGRAIVLDGHARLNFVRAVEYAQQIIQEVATAKRKSE